MSDNRFAKGGPVGADVTGPVQLSRSCVAIRPSGVKWLPMLCAINGGTLEETDVVVVPDDEPFPTSL